MGSKLLQTRCSWLAFAGMLVLSLALGAVSGLTKPARAAPPPGPVSQGGFAGPDACKVCHADIHAEWVTTRHANAFSSPIFQRDWAELGTKVTCLRCHTTGYDPATGAYSFEGVTCEACHGPFQPTHPQTPMPITPNADLCAACHKTTTDEWRASVHGQQGIQCQACHNPHSQTPKADSVTALCSNCHKERGDSFTHGTHAQAGLECSNCHMFTSPRTADPIEGLVATGHTFSVGSEACVACHQDTVHTRDKIVALTGEVAQLSEVDTEALRQKVQEQAETIASLEASRTVRLYTGLAQGAIVGLATGAVAAWVVSRRIRVIEQRGKDEQEEAKS